MGIVMQVAQTATTIHAWLPPRVGDLVIQPNDLNFYSDGDGGRTNYYSWYRWAATVSQPRIVAEIGVRLGYSAWALSLPGVSKVFLGFDNQSYIDDSNQQAAQFLAGRYNEVLIQTVDTQKVFDWRPLLDGRVPQLIHVDGDHTFAGCLHDLELAHGVLPVGGTLVVDDTAYLAEVRRACDEFLQRHCEYAVLTLDARLSYRGHYLMIRVG